MSERLRKRVALEHVGKPPHEAVGSIRYLMGDKKNYLTGQPLNINDSIYV